MYVAGKRNSFATTIHWFCCVSKQYDRWLEAGTARRCGGAGVMNAPQILSHSTDMVPTLFVVLCPGGYNSVLFIVVYGTTLGDIENISYWKRYRWLVNNTTSKVHCALLIYGLINVPPAVLFNFILY